MQSVCLSVFARMAMAAAEADESLESTRRELLETRALAQRACGSMRASVTLARERLDALQTAMQAKVAELEAAGTRTQAALEAETARRTRAELGIAELRLEVTAARQRLEAERSGGASASREAREAEELKAARFAQAQTRAKQLLGELQRRLTQQSGTLARQQEAMTRAQEEHEALQRQQRAALLEAGAKFEAQAAMIAKLQAERDEAAPFKEGPAPAAASRDASRDASQEEEQSLKTQVLALHAALRHALRDGLGSEQAKQLHATSQLLQQGALEMARRNGHLGAQLSETREQLHLLRGAVGGVASLPAEAAAARRAVAEARAEARREVGAEARGVALPTGAAQAEAAQRRADATGREAEVAKAVAAEAAEAKAEAEEAARAAEEAARSAAAAASVAAEERQRQAEERERWEERWETELRVRASEAEAQQVRQQAQQQQAQQQQAQQQQAQAPSQREVEREVEEEVARRTAEARRRLEAEARLEAAERRAEEAMRREAEAAERREAEERVRAEAAEAARREAGYLGNLVREAGDLVRGPLEVARREAGDVKAAMAAMRRELEETAAREAAAAAARRGVEDAAAREAAAAMRRELEEASLREASLSAARREEAAAAIRGAAQRSAPPPLAGLHSGAMREATALGGGAGGAAAGLASGGPVSADGVAQLMMSQIMCAAEQLRLAEQQVSVRTHRMCIACACAPHVTRARARTRATRAHTAGAQHVHVQRLSGTILQAHAAGLAVPASSAPPLAANSLPPMPSVPPVPVAAPPYAHTAATLGGSWSAQRGGPVPPCEEEREEGSALDRELSLIDGEIAHLQQALEAATEQAQS